MQFEQSQKLINYIEIEEKTGKIKLTNTYFGQSFFGLIFGVI